MKFYKYWVRENQREVDKDGKALFLQILGRSNESLERARLQAQERLAEIRKKIRRGESLRGGYSYGERMQCEQLIEEFTGEDGAMLAAVTRNRYHSLVLNTSDIVFADVDLPAKTIGQRLRSLFSKTKTRHEPQLKKIREYHRYHPSTVLRIYATRAGLRVLLLDRRARPGDPGVQEFFQAIDCDPVYIKLCRAQQSFRARLTPKYWRCGAGLPPPGYPWSNAVDEKRFAEWLQDYERVCEQWSVCEYIETLGAPRIDREFEKIIALHDRYTVRKNVTKLA